MNKLMSFQGTFVHVQFSAVSTTVHGLAWTALSTLSITTVICIQQAQLYTDSHGLLCPLCPSRQSSAYNKHNCTRTRMDCSVHHDSHLYTTSTTVHGLAWTALFTLSITTVICIQQAQLYPDSHGLLHTLCPL